MTEFIFTLYQYNRWANHRILDTAAHLDPDQFIARVRGSFDSVRDTLVHTMSAEWIWLSRWQGVSPSALFDPADYSDLSTLRERWVQIEQDTQSFVAAQDEDRLTRVISYTNTQGERYSYPLWQMMVHQINHGTQHRSEVATMLTQFGHSPGWLDLLVYLDQQTQADR
ncbi:MAG: DinB family protein [Ardenticatenaceae bacterium]